MAVNQPITIRIAKAIKDDVERFAQARHQSPDAMISEAIKQYVYREQKREEFQQDAIRAWDDYKKSGLPVLESNADAWLLKLEGGKDVEPPECQK
jgi:predicted transcriptional regulator